MKKALPHLLVVGVAGALLSAYAIRRSAGASDGEQRALLTAAFLAVTVYALHSKAARSDNLMRVIAAASVVLAGLAATGGLTAITDPDKALADGSTSSTNALPGSQSLEGVVPVAPEKALSADTQIPLPIIDEGVIKKLVTTAQALPPGGARTIDFALAPSGMRVDPNGDTTIGFTLQGPAGVYGQEKGQAVNVKSKSAPKFTRPVFAQGFLRFNPDGTLDAASPFAWAGRIADALDGGYARIMVAKTMPEDVANVFVALLAERNLASIQLPESGRAALAQERARQDATQAGASAEVLQLNARSLIERESPSLSGVLNKSTVAKDLGFWASAPEDPTEWLPLLLSRVITTDDGREMVRKGLQGALSHSTAGRHIVNLGGGDFADVTPISLEIYSDEELGAICPACAQAEMAAAAKINKSAAQPQPDPGAISEVNIAPATAPAGGLPPGVRVIDIVLEGMSGRTTDYGMSFIILDMETKERIGDGKLIQGGSTEMNITWLIPTPPRGVLINVGARPGLSTAMAQPVMNQAVRWFENNGIATNERALALK